MFKFIISIFFFQFVLLSCGQEIEILKINNTNVDVSDPSSHFYHDSIRFRLQQKDTTLTPLEILSYTWFVQHSDIFNPNEIDKKAKKVYRYNEKKKYRNAIHLAHRILNVSPNNITAFKEISLAYSKLNQKDSSKIYFVMMVKSIEAANLYGNGTYNNPILLNNSFELTSIFEAQFRLFPRNKGVIKDSKNQIRILNKSGCITIFGLINHWNKYLKSNQYVTEDLNAKEKSHVDLE